MIRFPRGLLDQFGARTQAPEARPDAKVFAGGVPEKFVRYFNG
jgi:hypothetical protein